MTAREEIISALFAALCRIEGIELCERNRTHKIDDDTASAIVLYDGDLYGDTDRKDAVVGGRNPLFPMTLTPQVWGYVEGSSETIGTQTNALFDKVMGALFRDRDLMQILALHDGGIGIDGAVFPTPAKATSPAAGAFMIDVSIPFVFDPTSQPTI